jgi:PTH1 family peptidyl-tRNA hydrolase
MLKYHRSEHDRQNTLTDTYLIVGLGNPGARYEGTRHNVGFRCVEAIAQKYNLTFSKTEHKSLTASGIIRNKRVLLAKPLTFMNLSGDAVQPLAHFYKIPVERLLVACDDLDIPFGTLRIRKSGSSGGQNGIRHIIERFGTQNIHRVRIGIGRPPGKMNPADYVLSTFKGDDVITALTLIDRAALAAETWLTDGIEAAMTQFNGAGEDKQPPKPKTTKTPATASSDDEQLL